MRLVVVRGDITIILVFDLKIFVIIFRFSTQVKPICGHIINAWQHMSTGKITHLHRNTGVLDGHWVNWERWSEPDIYVGAYWPHAGSWARCRSGCAQAGNNHVSEMALTHMHSHVDARAISVMCFFRLSISLGWGIPSLCLLIDLKLGNQQTGVSWRIDRGT